MSLKSTGILNKYMDPRSVIKLFSIYMRPILSYGMETMTMNGDELGLYVRTEGNILKQMIGILHSSNSTKLYDMFNLHKPETSLQINKIKLFIRMNTQMN